MYRSRLNGFTLIEVLVAMTILALMAGMAWRAMGDMIENSERIQAHTDSVLNLDTAMGQWNVDLDAIIDIPFLVPLDWDARSLRLTRRHAADAKSGVVVVAWTRSYRDGQTQWLRWQSPPLRSRQQWTQAWALAAQWAQSSGDAQRAHEVVLGPLRTWQIYFFRGGAWSNPLSAAGSVGGPRNSNALPDGIRLVLEVPEPHPLSGTLVQDWFRATTAQGTP